MNLKAGWNNVKVTAWDGVGSPDLQTAIYSVSALLDGELPRFE